MSLLAPETWSCPLPSALTTGVENATYRPPKIGETQKKLAEEAQ